MAANEYYNTASSHGDPRRADSPFSAYNPAPSHQEVQRTDSSYSAYNPAPSHEEGRRTDFPFSAYNPNQKDPSTISPISTRSEDPSYYGYGRQSEQSLPTNHNYPHHTASAGGRKIDFTPYDDDIPLQPHPPETPQKDYNPIVGRLQPSDPEFDERSLPARRHERRKRGPFDGRVPWVVYFLTLVQVSVFIGELARNGVLTKSPIEIHPQFNPMIGPSPYVLVNMGARFVPCMRSSAISRNTTNWPCPSTTTTDANCKLAQLCGFGALNTGVDSPQHQWYRFIIPMFLHAGFIHIGFNMMLQLTLGRDMEKEIGSIRFLLVYLSSGIFGFVLGGNFAAPGIASTGASGSLFGIIAILLLDLLYHWGERQSPWVELAWIILDIVISFVLGLLPGLDNFSHIGGFTMGLVLGICLLRSPDVLRQRIGLDEPPYSSVAHSSRKAKDDGGIRGFVKEPVGFFKGRKSLWWVWWLVRAAALIGALVSFIVLLKNFYKKNPTTCSWCKYLSCLPIKNWCDIGTFQPTKQPAKRDFLDMSPALNLF